jgi:stage V sporulation protein G
MEITDVRIMRVDADAKLKAYATVTFDNCFVVHNLKVIDGQTGRFVAMPSRKTKNGDFKDIAHPINSDFRKAMQTRILEEFDKQGGSGAPVSVAKPEEKPSADGSGTP